VSRGLGRRAIASAVGNEIEKGLLHAWGERLQILIELPLFLIFFLLLALVVGRGQEIASGHLDWRFDPAYVSSLLVGYAAFLFIYLQTAKLFWRLLGEIQAGTLEQVYLSPLPAWLVATAGRVLATVLETAALVLVLYLIVFAIVPFHLVWNFQALVPIAFLAVASVGYSLIEGGMVLAWRKVELIHELAVGLMVFFSGALIPLSQLPIWMADIGRLAPISEGVVALRAVLIDGHQSFPLEGDGGILWMTGISAAYLVIGIAVFSLGERRARSRGSLGRY
jgi:ABC-type polysaccharide/polyol phosphate export permease